MVRVRKGDHCEGADVVGHGERDEAHAQLGWQGPADEGEQTENERCVGADDD